MEKIIRIEKIHKQKRQDIDLFYYQQHKQYVLTIYQPTPEGEQKPQITYKITQIKITLVPRAKSSPSQGDSKESLTSTPSEITQIIMRNDFFFLSFFFKSVTQASCKNRNSVRVVPMGFKLMIFPLKLSRCSSAELTGSTCGSQGQTMPLCSLALVQFSTYPDIFYFLCYK